MLLPSRSQTLAPQELAQAVADLARYLAQSDARFSISGGAASMLIRMQHGLPLRSTEDIDLVVQPTRGVTAESISAWLLQNYPNAFTAKTLHGIAVPTLAFCRSDGSIKYVEIDIFDVNAWPERPQYDLDNPDNEVSTISVSGVMVPVFSARWLLREKIITAFERQGTRKEEADLDDACTMLDIVGLNCLDLTDHEAAVRYIRDQRPDVRQSLELKIVCPSVHGRPWTWKESAAVYWRLEKDRLRYLDTNLQRHKFKWDSRAEVWYLKARGHSWYYNTEDGDIVLWA